MNPPNPQRWHHVITVVYGEDELAKMRRLKELREEADGGSGMLDSNLTIIPGRDAKPVDILMQANAMPFLAPKRLVLVEDILDRFKPPRSDAPPGSEPRALKTFAPLFDGLRDRGLPPTTMLVFTGGSAGRTHPFIKALTDAAGGPGKVKVSLEDFPAMKPKELPRFVREEALLHGVHFKNGASRRPLPPEDEWHRPTETDPAILLANLHQPNSESSGRATPDTLSISQELQKLSLYAMGRDVTVDDVDEVCSGGREPNRWAFQDWVMDGDLAQALNALDYFARTDGSLQSVLGVLISGYRTLATVLDLIEDGASAEQVRRATGRAFGEEKLIRRARGLGSGGLRAAYEAMVAADRAIKSGETDEGIAMSILITRLADLARRRPVAANVRRSR